MEATLRGRGGAGQSCYGGFAACQTTRSTSELSDRSPGAASPVAAPEVAALEKTLKQLQLEVAACNQACNRVCRSLQPVCPACNPMWPGGGRGDAARGRRCAQRRVRALKVAAWWRHSSAAQPPWTRLAVRWAAPRTDEENPSFSNRHEGPVVPPPACQGLSPRAVVFTQARSSRWRPDSRRRTPTQVGGMLTLPRPRSRDAPPLQRSRPDLVPLPAARPSPRRIRGSTWRGVLHATWCLVCPQSGSPGVSFSLRL